MYQTSDPDTLTRIQTALDAASAGDEGTATFWGNALTCGQYKQASGARAVVYVTALSKSDRDVLWAEIGRLLKAAQ